MKDQAEIVVIGGGITGCSILYHLAKAGCKNVVLVEKGELTNGSTCMAAGLLTQLSTSPTMMRMRRYSATLYEGLGAFEKVGSLRIASSREQHETLQRTVSQARGIGLDVEIVGPEDALKIMPWMSGEDLYSAVHIPDDGHLDPHGTTHAVAKAARDLGAEIYVDTLVTGIELSQRGEVEGVRTNRGNIRTGTVINATGIWGPQVGAMVGARIPSTPVVHQHVALQAVSGQEVPDKAPCFRDTDYLIYGRPEHGGIVLGGWESDPPSLWEDGVPWSHGASEVASDFDRFEPLMMNAIKRYPFLAESGIERLVAHPDAITPDSNPLLGPWPGLPGFWLACGMSMHGFGAAGGIGKALAEWILEGRTEWDLHGFHAWRFGRNYNDPCFAAARARESYKYYYRTFYPGDERTSKRPRRLSTLHHRLQDLGAVFGEKNGWERVNYVMKGEPWRRAGEDQREWGGWSVRPPFFDTVAEEHQAIRERAGLVDLSSFGKIEVRGPGAGALLSRVAAGDMDKPVGSVVYTPFCNREGGIVADVTVARLAEDAFRIITGAGSVDNDMGHIRASLQEEDPPVDIRDVTEDYACIALWGPRAADVLQEMTHDDVSDEGLPYMGARGITVNGVQLWAQRLSYAGEAGWELYPAADKAVAVWDGLWTAGQTCGITAVGYKALDALRLEKGYLYYGTDITSLDNPLEAGLGFTLRSNGPDFLGRQALIRVREEGIRRKICTVVVGGAEWLPLYGGEAVIADNKVVSRLRSAGYGHTVKKNIGFAYLPVELAGVGSQLEIEVFGERIPSVVSTRVLCLPGKG